MPAGSRATQAETESLIKRKHFAFWLRANPARNALLIIYANIFATMPRPRNTAHTSRALISQIKSSAVDFIGLAERQKERVRYVEGERDREGKSQNFFWVFICAAVPWHIN